jgi:hypothetical protein
MPGAGFKRVAAQFKETNMRQVHMPIEFVLKQQVRSRSRLLPDHPTPDILPGEGHCREQLYFKTAWQ